MTLRLIMNNVAVVGVEVVKEIAKVVKMIYDMIPKLPNWGGDKPPPPEWIEAINRLNDRGRGRTHGRFFNSPPQGPPKGMGEAPGAGQNSNLWILNPTVRRLWRSRPRFKLS